MVGIPYIPETITVHLGAPDQPASNITLSFQDYIKNVASSEIFPTWPQASLRANIYAIISYTLNRVYTEWYRSRGYDFDITNTTQYDQAFVAGRNVFDSISHIVDEIFNDYIRETGQLSPFFAQYCDGRQSLCPGLSQWGSVELANRGFTPFEILTYYYGNRIELVDDAPVLPYVASYPGTPFSSGSTGPAVRRIQQTLSGIRKTYSAIPEITSIDGIFGQETEEAVIAFQRIFQLTPDGIVGKATWYKLTQIYVSLTRLASLDSEGVSLEFLQNQYDEVLAENDQGSAVQLLQYYLSYISYFNTFVPSVDITGNFDQATTEAVKSFQRFDGLMETGIVDETTWNRILDAYNGIRQTT